MAKRLADDEWPRMPANHETLRGCSGAIECCLGFLASLGAIHIFRTQALSCPPPQGTSMLLTGERSATCPDSVPVRREPCPSRLLRGIRCRSTLTCTMMSWFSSPGEMLQCMQNASVALRTRQTLPGTLTEAPDTATGLSINFSFFYSHDGPNG